MFKQGKTKRMIWILVMTFMFSVAANAATTGQNNPAAATSEVSSQPRTNLPMIRVPMLFTVRDIVGSDVKSMPSATSGTQPAATTARERSSQSTQTIGTFKEVIISDKENKIEYVVIDSDRKLYPVPWSAFNVTRLIRSATSRNTGTNLMQSENIGQDMYESSLEPANQIPESAPQKPNLYLYMTKEQFQKAPSISSVSTEKLSEPKMQKDIDSFYSKYMPRQNMQSGAATTGTTPSTTATSAAASSNTNLLTASKIFDLKLEGTSGADLHKIENIVADARQGSTLYAMVNFGGFIDIGEKTAAVPWSLITINEKENSAKISATRAQLNAAAVEQNQWYKLEQPQFAREIYSHFGVQPSTVYGFVPGEMKEQNFSAWQPDSTYNKNFNKDMMTTIKGTVRSVSTFEPVSGAAPGVELTVEASDGKMYTVYAGPQEYAKMKDFTCKTGDEIEIKGSAAQINNKSVVMASEIKNGNKTLSLYNSEGKPLWNTEQLMQQTIYH